MFNSKTSNSNKDKNVFNIPQEVPQHHLEEIFEILKEVNDNKSDKDFHLKRLLSVFKSCRVETYSSLEARRLVLASAKAFMGSKFERIFFQTTIQMTVKNSFWILLTNLWKATSEKTSLKISINSKFFIFDSLAKFAFGFKNENSNSLIIDWFLKERIEYSIIRDSELLANSPESIEFLDLLEKQETTNSTKNDQLVSANPVDLAQQQTSVIKNTSKTAEETQEKRKGYTNLQKLGLTEIKDLESEVSKISNVLSLKETEHNWESKDKCILRLRQLLRIPQRYEMNKKVIQGMKNMYEGIYDAASSPRTSLQLSGLNLINDLWAIVDYGLLDSYKLSCMIVLLKILGSTKKLVIDAAAIALKSVSINSSYSAKTLKLLVDGLSDKNQVLRSQVTEIILAYFKHHVQYGEKIFEKKFPTVSTGKEMLTKAITLGLTDANLKTREISRKLYWAAYMVWPNHIQTIYMKLDPVTKKKLDSEKIKFKSMKITTPESNSEPRILSNTVTPHKIRPRNSMYFKAESPQNINITNDSRSNSVLSNGSKSNGKSLNRYSKLSSPSLHTRSLDNKNTPTKRKLEKKSPMKTELQKKSVEKPRSPLIEIELYSKFEKIEDEMLPQFKELSLSKDDSFLDLNIRPGTLETVLEPVKNKLTSKSEDGVTNQKTNLEIQSYIDVIKLVTRKARSTLNDDGIENKITEFDLHRMIHISKKTNHEDARGTNSFSKTWNEDSIFEDLVFVLLDLFKINIFAEMKYMVLETLKSFVTNQLPFFIPISKCVINELVSRKAEIEDNEDLIYEYIDECFITIGESLSSEKAYEITSALISESSDYLIQHTSGERLKREKVLCSLSLLTSSVKKENYTMLETHENFICKAFDSRDRDIKKNALSLILKTNTLIKKITEDSQIEDIFKSLKEYQFDILQKYLQ